MRFTAVCSGGDSWVCVTKHACWTYAPPKRAAFNDMCQYVATGTLVLF